MSTHESHVRLSKTLTLGAKTRRQDRVGVAIPPSSARERRSSRDGLAPRFNPPTVRKAPLDQSRSRPPRANIRSCNSCSTEATRPAT